MDKIILDKFDWGWMDEPTDLFHIHSDGRTVHMGQYHKESIIGEIFERKCYEQFFEVEENDVVLDIGASVGPFTYSILKKKPKQVYCFEPSEREFKTLSKNVKGYPVIPIPKGISNINSIVESDELFGGEDKMETITFDKFINLYGVEKIDFIKTDCEGGEYDIFTEENLSYIKNNVKKIVGEWHLKNPDLKQKFRNFRDNILSHFKYYYIFSVDGIDIKWDLWNEHFIEYYTEIIIHIDNR
jgi:FkbM family methyltransferase